jgi:hypothetical protein
MMERSCGTKSQRTWEWQWPRSPFHASCFGSFYGGSHASGPCGSHRQGIESVTAAPIHDLSATLEGNVRAVTRSSRKAEGWGSAETVMSEANSLNDPSDWGSLDIDGVDQR